MIRSADICQALRERYEAPQWALFFEVPSATGGGASRRADAIAMALWPSLGLEVVGFEIKVDRRDWLRERKNLAKSQEFMRFCDRWFIVATPGVVKPDEPEELPPAWGLLEFQGQKLRQVREAPKLEPQPITRPFLASMLRAASEANPAEEAIRKAVEAVRKEERSASEKARKANDSHIQRLYEALRKQVDDFESASGIIVGGNSAQIGATVRLAMQGKWELQPIERAAGKLRDLADLLDKVRAEVAALKPSAPEGPTP